MKVLKTENGGICIVDENTGRPVEVRDPETGRLEVASGLDRDRAKALAKVLGIPTTIEKVGSE